jgi:hypothetical protein
MAIEAASDWSGNELRDFREFPDCSCIANDHITIAFERRILSDGAFSRDAGGRQQYRGSILSCRL